MCNSNSIKFINLLLERKQLLKNQLCLQGSGTHCKCASALCNRWFGIRDRINKNVNHKTPTESRLLGVTVSRYNRVLTQLTGHRYRILNTVIELCTSRGSRSLRISSVVGARCWWCVGPDKRTIHSDIKYIIFITIWIHWLAVILHKNNRVGTKVLTVSDHHEWVSAAFRCSNNDT